MYLNCLLKGMLRLWLRQVVLSIQIDRYALDAGISAWMGITSGNTRTQFRWLNVLPEQSAICYF